MSAVIKFYYVENMQAWLRKVFKKSAWAPLSVFIFYVIAAKGFNAYMTYPWLDMPTHFVGGAAMTYFFWIAAIHVQPLLGDIPKLVQLILSCGLTAITAITWEFLEFISDFTLGTKMNLGVVDTLSDLFFGLLGAVVLVTLIYRKDSRSNK